MTGFYPRGIALHEKLRRLAIEAGECPLTMGDGLRRLAAGANGYGIPLLLLSLPGALPMPALGLNSLLGVVVTLLGLQMFAGKRSVWLPHRFTRIRLRPDWSQRAARLAILVALLFFIAGLVLLLRVDEQRGKAAALSQRLQ